VISTQFRLMAVGDDLWQAQDSQGLTVLELAEPHPEILALLQQGPRSAACHFCMQHQVIGGADWSGCSLSLAISLTLTYLIRSGGTAGVSARGGRTCGCSRASGWRTGSYRSQLKPNKN
jgi:hypothetical protein